METSSQLDVKIPLRSSTRIAQMSFHFDNGELSILEYMIDNGSHPRLRDKSCQNDIRKLLEGGMLYLDRKQNVYVLTSHGEIIVRHLSPE